MANKENTIWLRNSAERTVGIISVTASKLEPKGWMSINCNPMSVSIDLTPEQMREVASQLIAAAVEMEQRKEAAAA